MGKNQSQRQFSSLVDTDKQWTSIYFLGGVSSIIVLKGILLDIVIGNITGGNLSALPQTAIDRFIQFHDNKFLGLYNLELFNIINQMIMIPVYFALYAVPSSVTGRIVF